MSTELRNEIKDQVKFLLKQLQKDNHELADDASLVMSGLLNSLKIIELATWLENQYKIDFGKIGFSIYYFETIGSIEKLIAEHAVR